MSVLSPESVDIAKWEGLSGMGEALELSDDKFGMLRDSSSIAFDADALRERMAEDGYLFLPGLLHRDEVLAARRVIAQRLELDGNLLPGTDLMDLKARPGSGGFRPDLAGNNPELMKVLYEGPMIELYERLLGGEVRHFDFTWFRAVGPGQATPPHTDSVYMNRGTLNLFTSWTPLSDVRPEVGGLMVLEGSHQVDRLRRNYSTKDVDTFCSNRRDEGYKEMGGGGNISHGGWLSRRPAKLREALGGRWLTSEFHMGDVLIFSIFTVHASTDNRSDEIRLSSDSRYQLASEPADERWVGENPIGHGPAGKRGKIC